VDATTYFSKVETAACDKLVLSSLQEDLTDTDGLSGGGDLTGNIVLPRQLDGQAVIVARQVGVVAGLSAAAMVFAHLPPAPIFSFLTDDGARIESGEALARIEGQMRVLVAGERTALNFLQRLSGVATLTRRFVDAVAGLPVQILDTRKTTPGWRLLEKYAVRCGGGHNHRIGLSDGILIKDNHLAALGGGPTAVTEAVRKARQQVGHSVPVEVEVEDFVQLDAALAERPDIILLDNMNLEQMRGAVRRRNQVAPEIKLEASGGITLQTVRAIAETGVDRISVGALTHSAPALDIALDYAKS